MPVTNNFKLPASAKELALPKDGESAFFITFISSIDPKTNQSWCPDVRAALPYISAAFSPDDGPEVGLVEAGQRPAWKEPGNVFRTDWNVHNVPTLVRFERVDGKMVETGRLVEDEILDRKKLYDLIGKAVKWKSLTRC